MTYSIQRNDIDPARRMEGMEHWDWLVVGPYPPAPHVNASWGFKSQQEAEEYRKMLEAGKWTPNPDL